MSKYEFRKIIYLTLTVLIVSFIFYNSFQNGESSGEASTKVLLLINNMLQTIGLGITLTGNFIRKLAHFTEFFVFGTFLMLTFEAFFKKTISIIGFPLFFSIFIPVVDEYIQIFSIGRVSSVKDVFIDFFGAATGIIFVCLWIFIKQNYENRYKNKYGKNKYKNNLI